MTATQVLDSLLSAAHARGASDLHLDPLPDSLRVSIRVDGLIIELEPVAKKLHQPLIARMKILAHVRTDEHAVPQDGRFRHELGGDWLDVRLCIMPTFYGENAVLRLLPSSRHIPSLYALGLSDAHIELLDEALRAPRGMLLLTGPTGSGKTTTLYALLRTISQLNLSLVTIEDPIEYFLPEAVHIPIREHAGFSYAHALRSVLRQDPDLIMIGEIRDGETASLASRAALTGQVVLSTLHTNDAPSALPRLVDLGVEPYLVASTLSVVAAERLVRTICNACSAERRLSAVEWSMLCQALACELPDTTRKGIGCETCSGTGYRGRTGVFEVMRVSDRFLDDISARAPASTFRERALADGMVPLLTNAIAKVLAGKTTYDEILRLRYA